MPRLIKAIITLCWIFLCSLATVNTFASSNVLNNAGINTTLFICADDTNAVDLFSSLNGDPDIGGEWSEVSPYGVDLDNPSAVDLSFLETGPYQFIYTFSATSTCPESSATLTILLQTAPDLDDVFISTFCDDNDTPTDLFDDTFSYTVLVNAPSTGSGSVMTGSGFIVSSDPSQTIYPYNTTTGLFGDDLIDDGSVFITVSSVSSNGVCVSEPIEILPPENCSECNESVVAETSFALACTNPSVLLTGSGSTIGTYTWTGSNGFESNIPNPTVTDTGTYVLTIFFDNGCVESDSVYVASNISIPEVDAGVETTLDCTDLSTQLNGITSIDNPIIEWSSNDSNFEENTSLSPIVTDTGWYYLNITNPANGCSNIDSVFIQPANPIEWATINTIPIGCENTDNGIIEIETITGGTAPFLYSINEENFISNNTFDNLTPNDYTINIEDSNGCTLDTIVTIQTSSSFDLNLGDNIEIPLGNSVQLLPFINLNEGVFIDNITWTNESTLSCFDCPNPFATPSNTTTYTVSMENNLGCIETDEITIFVDQTSSIYIPNAFSPNNDGVNDIFQIYSDDILLINEFNIYDRWGNQVFRATDIDPSSELGWDGTFRGQMMNPAVFVYYINVELLNGQNRILKGDVTLVK